jgi:tyrosyl-tRNA synthetase
MNIIENLISLVEIQVPDNCIEKKINKSKEENRPLIVKLGFDPTAPDLHLGHAVVLRKLRQFQEFGHNVIVIIGDFTACIGDPTGKNKSRPPLTAEQVLNNATTYINQLSKILDISKIQIKYNSEWLNKMNLSDTIKLLSKITVAQILQRTDFNNRYNNNIPISMHELIYPLLQGQDSVIINADLEIGGTDQLFNCMVGKHLQEINNLNGQGVICMPLLKGIDGSLKMSKSENNFIGLNENPFDMYGKAMSIPDELLPEYINLVTDFSQEKKIEKIEQLKNGINPMLIKKEIAFNIVEIYHNSFEAQNAEMFFYKQCQNKDNESKEFTIFEIHDQSISILELCCLIKSDESRSQIKRIIIGGGVEIDNNKVLDPNLIIKLTTGIKLKIGKRNFYEIKL